MDFIERLFGFAPDGGSGSLELMLVSITLAVAFVIGLRRVVRRQKRVRLKLNKIARHAWDHTASALN